jgi:hypothetical protein
VRLEGRRLPDARLDDWPAEIQAGDYWKLLGDDGELRSENPQNLTGTCWIVVVPMSYGYAVGQLVNHTVREEDDRTISVRPGDGSSNSILVTGHRGEQWHGYVDHGVLWTVAEPAPPPPESPAGEPRSEGGYTWDGPAR